MNSTTQTIAARLPPLGITVDDARAVDHAEEPCAICGGASVRGVPLHDELKPTTTDQGSFRSPCSEYVCVPCVFVRSRVSPVHGREPKEGKAFGGNYRNYSHFVDADRYENASKGEKPRVVGWLRGPKRGAWGCAIADSGQKHVLNYAPINPAGATRGRVRFEEQIVALPGADGWQILDDLTALLTAGATKEDVQRGDYCVRAWTLCPDLIRAFEAAHGRLRGAAWFSLVLWLAQRDEEQVATRMEAEKQAKTVKAKAAKRRTNKPMAAKKEKADGKGERREAREDQDGDRRGLARGAPGVPARGHEAGAEALGDAREPGALSGTPLGVDGRVDDPSVPRVADPDTGQFGLFGGDGAVAPRSGARATGRARSGRA